MKAYVHQGRAHLGLKQYDKALESYEKAAKCDPKKEAVMNGMMRTCIYEPLQKKIRVLPKVANRNFWTGLFEILNFDIFLEMAIA